MANELEAAEIAALAVDDARLRQTALTLAVSHYRKINFTGSADKITALAGAFHRFLKGQAND